MVELSSIHVRTISAYTFSSARALPGGLIRTAPQIIAAAIMKAVDRFIFTDPSIIDTRPH
jgi:hypothetical protein